MMNERFTVMSHDFTNTGGSCMVSSFAVYDKQLNVTRYVLVNEEGFVLATVDYICNEIQFESDEQERAAVVDNWSFDELTTEPCWDQHQFTDEEWHLYKYCQFEYYKRYCEYFNTKIHLPVDQLPNEMYNELGQPAIEWHLRNEQYVSTDGHQVYFNDNYDAAGWEKTCKELQQIKDFQQWYDETVDDDDKRYKLAEEDFVISLAGRSVRIPFNADSYSAIDALLKMTIKEW